MDGDTIQVDIEHGVLPPSPIQVPTLSAVAGLGRSASFSPISSPQSAQTSDSAIEEKFSLDDGFGSLSAQTIDQVMSGFHRRDTGPLGQAQYGDPSAKIWGLYLSLAEKFDKGHGDSWAGNTDGVLVFTGLFSATVATFIVASYQSLQPNSSDTAVLLLSQISQQLTALANGTPSPPPLSLPRCGFLQTYPFCRARQHAVVHQSWHEHGLCVVGDSHAAVDPPPKRARIRAFFADGVEKFALGAAVEVLPVLLHTSVLIFYIGLIDFLLNINHTVAFIMLSLVALCVLVYFVLSIMPLFYHNSPYQTPVSSLFWFFQEVAPLVKLWFHKRTEGVQRSMAERREKIALGMRRALEKTAAGLSWEWDSLALRWTLMSLDEDHELEEFLDGLPGLFRTSSHPPAPELRTDLEEPIETVADRLLATCSTGLLSEPARRQRLTVSLGAIWCFRRTMERHYNAGASDPWCPLSTETWVMAANMTADQDPVTALRAHCVQALIVIMRRYGRWHCPKSEWSALLQRQLGVSSGVVERFLHGDSLQLAVAANLLSNALPLLRKMEDDGGPATSLKVEVKAILDSICHGLDASSVSEDLRSLFVDSTEVLGSVSCE
ncbi:hypothetical protein EDB83DRAFT_2654891 [Lactarius deliciosus]|nr:hypothetical protein EDB83DRAFT_2654891 [Lactarius deliciosus]